MWTITPPHTPEDVARDLIAGLKDGRYTLDISTPDAADGDADSPSDPATLLDGVKRIPRVVLIALTTTTLLLVVLVSVFLKPSPVADDRIVYALGMFLGALTVVWVQVLVLPRLPIRKNAGS